MSTGLVLIVEDHADTRHMMEEYFRFHHIPVISADNGLTGLAALHAHRPCIVLLDLSMPVMDGWRFRQEQQRLLDTALAGTPVVVLSALADAPTHADALGAVGLIPKPIDFDRMIAVVRSYCASAAE
jgi:CheY-like chemotaxis protein